MDLHYQQKLLVVRRLNYLSYTLLLFYFACVTYAESRSVFELLKPYTAIYKSKIKGLDILFERKLSVTDNEQLVLQMQGKKFIFKVSEVSNFMLDGNIIVPINYKYTFSGSTKRRKEIQFNLSKGEIDSLVKEKWFKLPYEAGILDRLSVQEQLRLLLIISQDIPEKVRFRVADGSRIKDYTFSFRGEENLPTHIGDLKTIRFAREFKDPNRLDSVWLAPALDYLMVKHTHKENGRSRIVSINMETKSVESIYEAKNNDYFETMWRGRLQIFDNSIFIQEHDSGRIIHLKCKNALERLDCTQSTFLDLNKMWGHQFEILF